MGGSVEEKLLNKCEDVCKFKVKASKLTTSFKGRCQKTEDTFLNLTSKSQLPRMEISIFTYCW